MVPTCAVDSGACEALRPGNLVGLGFVGPVQHRPGEDGRDAPDGESADDYDVALAVDPSEHWVGLRVLGTRGETAELFVPGSSLGTNSKQRPEGLVVLRFR